MSLSELLILAGVTFGICFLGAFAITLGGALAWRLGQRRRNRN